jgi:hypothetical protein
VAVLCSCSCNSKENGFYLQQFEIKNTQLDSIIQIFIDNEVKTVPNAIPILILHSIDSIPAFYLTETEKKYVSVKYIFQDNNRIVGYTEVKNSDVIILSTINSKFDFEMEFYKYLIPKNNTRLFEFVYFPNDLYCTSLTEDIPCPPMLFHYQYQKYVDSTNNIKPYRNVSD